MIESLGKDIIIWLVCAEWVPYEYKLVILDS